MCELALPARGADAQPVREERWRERPDHLAQRVLAFEREAVLAELEKT